MQTAKQPVPPQKEQRTFFKDTAKWPSVGYGPKYTSHQGANAPWSCPKCDYSNEASALHCEICSTPRPSAPTKNTASVLQQPLHGSCGVLSLV